MNITKTENMSLSRLFLPHQIINKIQKKKKQKKNGYWHFFVTKLLIFIYLLIYLFFAGNNQYRFRKIEEYFWRSNYYTTTIYGWMHIDEKQQQIWK